MGHAINGLPVIGHKLIATSLFLWKIILAMTYKIEHVEKSFQVVTYSTICSGHIEHSDYDIIIYTETAYQLITIGPRFYKNVIIFLFSHKRQQKKIIYC